MTEYLDEFAELAGVAHDLAIWYQTHDVACPCCGVYRQPHGPRCPIGRAEEYRRRNVSTV